MWPCGYPVSIVYKFIAGRYRPVRVADGPITACYIFIKNASWVLADCKAFISCLVLFVFVLMGLVGLVLCLALSSLLVILLPIFTDTSLWSNSSV